jgi:hypothetical protein
VTVIRGDLINDMGAKQRIVHESEEPVTGLELSYSPITKDTTLFISTTSRIIRLVVSKRGHGQPPKTVEDAGCAVGCMTSIDATGEIIVAREDALYYYTMDGRGPPRAYECPKSLVSVYKEYVALVCPPAERLDRSPEPMRRRYGGAADALFSASTFVLLEPDLRVVAHSKSLISPIKAVFQIWGDLLLMTQDGKVSAQTHTSPLFWRAPLTSFADPSLPGKGAPATPPDVVPAKHVPSGARPRAEGRNGCHAAELHI